MGSSTLNPARATARITPLHPESSYARWTALTLQTEQLLQQRIAGEYVDQVELERLQKSAAEVLAEMLPPVHVFCPQMRSA